MKRGQNKDRGEPQGRRRRRKSRSGALVAHRTFAPLLGLWGAAVGGLSVMLLPPAVIARAVPIADAAIPVQPAIALAAALLLGGACFLFAASLARRGRRTANPPSIVMAAMRHVQPIDPQRDLGTRSLDDPIDSMPFANPLWRADLAADEGAAIAPEAPAAPLAEPLPPAPEALDLAAFANLPGRNGVWVEAPEPAAVSEPELEPVSVAVDGAPADAAEAFAIPAAAETQAAPSAAISTLHPPAPHGAEPGTAALARLRAVPPSELSLAEMVERFAGALHERRTSPPARGLTAAELGAREAALAEALRALAALSGGGAAGGVSEGTAPLAAAITNLRKGRDAA